jgi:tRNA pseudouridine55 synthase
VLVVDKAPGGTSFDVVALVRSRLRARRVGHAGTLDPAATGVLPILIGEATKLMPYLADQDKEYLVTVRFGVRTDTQDLTGRVLAHAGDPVVTRAGIEAASRAFVGTIRQVPPMYSAVHREGRRLYELAREGIEVERAPREVVIHAIAVEEVAGPTARLRVACGKGTYIRALAADLGDRLGCGGAVQSLVRLRVGPFSLAEAVPGAEIARMAGEALWDRVRPPESALAGWPSVALDERAARAFRNGQPGVVKIMHGAGGRLVVVRTEDGAFLGVGELIAAGSAVKPVRILHADHPGSRPLRA